MNRKLVFLDIDGTLTVPGTNVPPESAVQAVRQAQANGHKVYLCSGRNWNMLSPLLVYGFDGVVASSGGYVVVGDEVIYDDPMSDEQRDAALAVLHKNGVFCTIEASTGAWGDSNLEEFLKGQPEGNSEIERWRKALAGSLGIRPMEEYDGSPVHKIVIMCPKAEQLDEARELLEKDFSFAIQDIPEHGCVNGEIISRSFDKGKGVLAICEKEGIPVEDTIGFGDSMNDLEMIRTVGIGVCMANGSETLKGYSDRICPAVEEDGLWQGFKDLGLI